MCPLELLRGTDFFRASVHPPGQHCLPHRFNEKRHLPALPERRLQRMVAKCRPRRPHIQLLAKVQSDEADPRL